MSVLPKPVADTSSCYKSAFIVLSLTALIVMPVLSLDFGITWDEPDHNTYGKLLLNYFLSFGNDKSSLSFRNLYLYGGMFDTITALFQKLFSLFEVGEYEVRHALNALTGGVAIFFTGLTAKKMGGWLPACLALLFIVLSPRFFGHSMNNPKDIPFAAGYIMTTYFSLHFFDNPRTPKISLLFLLALSFGLMNGVRIGGLMFGFYLAASGVLFYLTKKYEKKYISGVVLFKNIAIVLAAGFFVGLIFWPFAHQNPIVNPLVAVKTMANFTTYNGHVLFEGEYIETTKLPWYYVLKWMVLTTPEIITAGFFAFFFVLYSSKKKSTNFDLFFLVLTIFFPLVFPLFYGSIVYDGWRHFLFIYPGLVVISAISIDHVLQSARPLFLKRALYGTLVVLLSSPLLWMIKNHPNETVYFNRLSGGVDKAFTRYETDYWGNSFKEAATWVSNHLKPENSEIPIRIKIYNGHPVSSSYYLNKKEGFFVITGNKEKDWDYLLLHSRFLPLNKLKNSWPPPGTIYPVTAENTVLSAVVQK